MNNHVPLLTRILVFFIFSILLPGPSHGKGFPTQEITIVSTNDIHASIANFPRLAALVNELRETERPVLLIDAGDKFSGDPCIDDAPSPGWPIMELMGTLGYDVMVPGNHSFDYGFDQFLLLSSQAKEKYPSLHFLSSDMDAKRKLLDIYRPFVSLSVGGIRIGLISLTDASSCAPSKLGGTTFRMPPDSWIRSIKKDRKLDLFILVSHMGVNKDREIAGRFPEIDLIIGGHSHTTLLRPLSENGVLITQTGCNLKYAGITTISPEGKLSNRLVELASYPNEVPAIKASEETIKRAADNQHEVANTTVRIDPPHLAELVCDAMKEAANADMAFYNIRGIRIDEIPIGPITPHQLQAMEPFHNTVFICSMTEGQIRDMIRNRLVIDEKHAPHSPRIDLYCSGLEYHIEHGKSTEITLRFPKSTSSVSPPVYQVAISDYLLSTYDIPNKKEVRSSGITVRQAVIDYFRKHPKIKETPPLRASISYQTD